MNNNRFFIWLPLAWRVPVIIISISGLSLIAFSLYASAHSGTGFSDVRLLNMAWMTLVSSFFLISRCARHTESENERWAINSIFAVSLVGSVILGPVGEAFRKQKDDAETRWAISNICSENGAVKPDRIRECLTHASRICVLGATPMNACEVRLRKTLKLEVPDEKS